MTLSTVALDDVCAHDEKDRKMKDDNNKILVDNCNGIRLVSGLPSSRQKIAFTKDLVLE